MSNTIKQPRVWRLKTKPPCISKTKRQLLINKMLNESFVGTGWPIANLLTNNLTRESSIGLLQSENLKSHHVAVRFINQTRKGDLIWIVGLDGHYHLAEVKGGYRYQASTIDWEKELSHQFPCHWRLTGLPSSEVPSGVINALLQGQAYCRIRNESAIGCTQILASGIPFEAKNCEDFLDLVDHVALEDLVGLYLQTELNGLLLPSSAKRSNAAYEFVIVSRTESKMAIVQVKSGNSSIDQALESQNAECYLFALNGGYPAELKNNKIISNESLVEFAYSNRKILPKTITCWMTPDSKKDGANL